MVAHHGVGAYVNREHLGQFKNPATDPVSPVAEIPPALDVNTTKILAPHTPRDHVVVGRGIQRDKLTARHGHGGPVGFESVIRLAPPSRFGYRKTSRIRVGILPEVWVSGFWLCASSRNIGDCSVLPEPPWYGPVCPVVWEGCPREGAPYPMWIGQGLIGANGRDRLTAICPRSMRWP